MHAIAGATPNVVRLSTLAGCGLLLVLCVPRSACGTEPPAAPGAATEAVYGVSAPDHTAHPTSSTPNPDARADDDAPGTETTEPAHATDSSTGPSSTFPTDAPPASDVEPELRALIDDAIAFPAPAVTSDSYWAREAETRAAAEEYFAVMLAQADASGAYDDATCAPTTWLREVAQGRMSYDRYTMLSMAMLGDQRALPEHGTEVCPVDPEDPLSGEWMGFAAFAFYDAASPQVKLVVARTTAYDRPLDEITLSDPDYYRQAALRLGLDAPDD